MSDQFEAEARRIVGMVLYNEDRVGQVAAALRQAAKEAQLRVLDSVYGPGQTTLYARQLRALIEKEGPL